MLENLSFSSKKVILFMFIFAFLCTSNLLAGITGKIAGKVIDQTTGEPMLGANVIIDGTTMGASTDEEGFYFIINVPPGKYSVSVSYIGYEKLTKSEVMVKVDRTTSLDFSLKVTAIRGSEVTVVATRPIIETDVTGSVEIMDASFLERSPVTDLNQALRQQTGFYNTGETTYLRGGLANELTYQIDGISLNSGTLGDNWQRLNITSIQELSSMTGGYNAEYGNAMSGVVNVVTKEASTGSRNLHGVIKYRLRPAGQYYWGRNMYDKSLWKYTNFDLAHWQAELEEEGNPEAFAKYFQRFYGWDGDDVPTAEELYETYQEQLTPDPVLKDANKRHQHEIEATVYGSPMNKVNFLLSARYLRGVNIYPQAEEYNPEYNVQAKINYYLSNSIKLSLNLLRGGYATCSYTESNFNNYESSMEARWQPAADVRDPYDSDRSHQPWNYGQHKGREKKTINMAALKLQHTLSPSTFYTINLSYLGDEMSDIPIERFKYDLETVGFGDNWSDVGGYFRLQSNYMFVRNNLTSNAYAVKADLTSQVHKAHQIKTGASIKYSNVDYRHHYIELAATNSWHLPNVFDGNPLETSLYLQDKMEYAGFILNMGIRVDAFNALHKYAASIYDPLCAQTWNGGDDYYPSNTAYIWWANEPAPDFFAGLGQETDYQYYFDDVRDDKNTVNSKWKVAVAPRLGIAFPVTDNSKIRFSYGHFYQRPSWTKILGYPLSFRQSDPLRVTFTGWHGWYGNPGLTYERTIQYELGFEQNLFDVFSLDMVAYYKDGSQLNRFSHNSTYNVSGGAFSSTGWGEGNVETSSRAYPMSSGGATHFYTNNVFKDTRGLELTLKKHFYRAWSANFTFNYGFSSGGATGINRMREDASRIESPHSFEERKVTWISGYVFKGNIAYVTPTDFGPLGTRLLGGMTISLYSEYFSGPQYTWYPKDYQGIRVPNNKRWYPHLSTDLKFTKRFSTGNIKPTIGLEVFNLFNNFDRILLSGKELDAWEQDEQIPVIKLSGEPNIWGFYNTTSNPKRQISLTLGLEF